MPISRLVRALRGALILVHVVVFSMLSGACGGVAIPRVALEHDRAGAQHLVAGRLDEAEARLRLALEYSPGFAEAHANLGLVALARGHLREAERALRTAVSLDPDLAIAWGDLGVVHERLGDDEPGLLDEAQRDYEAALAIEPGQTGARRNLGLLLARLGRPAEARAHLLRLLELTPDDVEAAGVLAWCELRLERPQAAIRRADAALLHDPEAASPRLVRGVARAQRGDLDGAAADLAQAAARGALVAEAQLRLATVEALRGRYVEATALVRALLVRGAEDAAVRYVAAVVALAADDGAAARRHAEAALRLRPSLAEARVLLARICELEGDAACVAAARGSGGLVERSAALAPSR